MSIDFYEVSEVYSATRDMYMLYKQKGYKYEEQLETIILAHYKFSRDRIDKKFDTTQVKKLSEKAVISYEFKVKYMMPLISIDGLVYLTDERIYM